jgi:uncharacterized protein YgiM (DUF1202 family)
MTDDSFEPGNKARVIQDYRARDEKPLTIAAGELLTCGKKDPDWPGWIWCTNWKGKGGWVPESYLSNQGENWTALRDYTARELSVKVGEFLTLRDLESGWYWASDRSGRSGWVPAKNVEILAET